jgi:hypothetical protein
MNLRDYAQGMFCTIRVPGICNGNPETTVLCHVRMIGISGMGMKSPDLLGAWGCSACHDYVDGKGGDPYLRRLMLLEGVMRTQAHLIEQGKVSW